MYFENYFGILFENYYGYTTTLVLPYAATPHALSPHTTPLISKPEHTALYAAELVDTISCLRKQATNQIDTLMV